jgi:hypothetical protein
MKKMPSVRSLIVVSAAIGVAGLSLARAQQPGASQPGTQWSEAQLRQAVWFAPAADIARHVKVSNP